jgi:hypothetical protein
MVRYRFPFIILVILFWGCQDNRPAEGTPSPLSGAPAGADSTELAACFDGVRLRQSPGPQGAVLAELPSGTPLTDLREVSPFVTQVELRGHSLEEPWLKVATTDGRQGWIYGGVLHFCDKTAQGFLHQKRLQAFFSAAQVDRMTVYRRDFQAARTARDLSEVYREALSLREELVNQLDNRLAQLEGNRIPNLFWLEDLLPGFVLQLDADGTAYRLFVDFRQWAKQAEETPSTADNAFFELCFQTFPQDSIEYFFPAWTIQVWDNSGHSLLGRGIHRQILREMDQVLNQSDLFQPEIQRMKTDLINDMTRPHVTYWETQERIIHELEQILAGDYLCLDRRDRVGLEARLIQFRDPGKHGIELNYKSGEQGL